MLSPTQTNPQSGGIKSPFGSGTGSLSLMETVKEKIDNVRHGRKRSKETSHVKTENTGTDVPHNLVDQEQLSHQLAEFTLNNNEGRDERHLQYMQQPEVHQKQNNQENLKREQTASAGSETIKNVTEQRFREQAQIPGEDERHPYSR